MRRSSCPYNEQRPHQGIDDQTPAERYRPRRTLAAPLGELQLAEPEKTADYPPHSVLRKVSRHGIVAYDGLSIILGRRYAGPRVRISDVGELVHVFLGEQLIRALAPDRERRYQRLNTPKRRRP